MAAHSLSNAEAQAINPNVEVLESRAITLLFSMLRKKEATQREFVAASDRLMTLLAEEGLARLPSVQPVDVVTPTGTYAGLSTPETDKICCVDIIRSGCILLEAFRKICPDAKTAKILIQRNESSAEREAIDHNYAKLPPTVAQCDVVLCDPMLATGGSSIMAIDILKKAGVPENRILFLNVICCPEGLARLAQETPEVRILTAGVDAGLNEEKFICPGLGDYGDRYYGTAGYEEGFWGVAGK